MFANFLSSFVSTKRFKSTLFRDEKVFFSVFKISVPPNVTRWQEIFDIYTKVSRLQFCLLGVILGHCKFYF